MEDLGQRIRERRRKKNPALEQFSPKSLSKSFLNRIEKTLAQPSVSSSKGIVQCPGISALDSVRPKTPSPLVGEGWGEGNENKKDLDFPFLSPPPCPSPIKGEGNFGVSG